MVNMLYLRRRAEIGLDGSKVTIFTFKTKNIQDSRKNLKMKMKTRRHYSMKIAFRPLNKFLIH